MRGLQFGDLLRSHVVHSEDRVDLIYDKFYDLWKNYLQIDNQIIQDDDAGWKTLSRDLDDLLDIFLQILKVQNFEIKVTQNISLHNVWV